MNIIRTMLERVESARRKELPLEPATQTATASSAHNAIVDSLGGDPFQAMQLQIQANSARQPNTSGSSSTNDSRATTNGLPNINLVQVKGSELLSNSHNSQMNTALSSLSAIKGELVSSSSSSFSSSFSSSSSWANSRRQVTIPSFFFFFSFFLLCFFLSSDLPSSFPNPFPNPFPHLC